MKNRKNINDDINIDKEPYIECGDCRYFSFFEGSEDSNLRGKCYRDSLFDFYVVKATDRRCRSCSTCIHPVLEDNVWKCKWKDQIGFSEFILTITPECKYYESK